MNFRKRKKLRLVFFVSIKKESGTDDTDVLSVPEKHVNYLYILYLFRKLGNPDSELSSDLTAMHPVKPDIVSSIRL